MIKRLRFVIVFLVLTLIGALQYAVPFFNDDSQQERTKFSIDVSYESETSPVVVKDYSQVKQGSFFLEREGQEGYQLSPLIDTKVDLKITGLIARAKVTQVFTNNSEHWVNGIYVFPLPENAAVDHLEMQIGERKIMGEIHPKHKAKMIYEQAKRQGNKASLLAQQRPNIFKNSVANIGPGESISVTIEYQQAVTYDSGQFSLRFPTTITPRYQTQRMNLAENGWAMTQPDYAKDIEAKHKTSTSSSEHVKQDKDETPTSSSENTKHETFTPLNKVSIAIDLDAGISIDRIVSQFHPITIVESNGHKYQINLQQSMIANQDFVLQWQASQSYAPMAAHFTQPFTQSNLQQSYLTDSKSSKEYFGMVMLMPSADSNDQLILPREVIFIIDTSGSMSGESMQQAKIALSMAIDDLAESDKFNLIEFDSTARRMWSQPRLASLDHKTDAKLYVGGLNADGGTEMLSALQLALGNQANADNESIRQVIFITDGAVGNENQLLGYVSQNLANSRLFTVGIGSAPNSFFMTEVALMGKGTFTYVGSVNDVQQEMKTLFSKLKKPLLTDLIIHFPDGVEFYPSQLPDLYHGEPLMVSYKSQSMPNKLMVSGNLKNQYWQKGLNLINGAAQTGLDVLWARRKIAQLQRNKVLGHDHASMNSEIETVAMKHHLVSSMTSLVAVDVTPTAQAIAKDAMAKSILPKGLRTTNSQAVGNLPNTATNAQLHALIALILMGIGICTVIFTRSR